MLPPWYALAIRAQREFHIERDLIKCGIETYLPTRRKKHWRQLEIDTPLIPGYVFARGEQQLLYAALRFNPYLYHVLGDGDEPIEIPAWQIETLRLMVTKSQQPIEVTPLVELWHGGEEIEITAGPLSGTRGRVAFVKGKARLIVQIEMLGRAVSTELDAAAVKALPAELPKAA
jgi:transcription antitermination factor NusG